MNKSFELTPTRVRELRAFAASAQLLNFSLAAKQVGCTPSVLSRRIAALEAAVGARLFLRTTRRVVLTARGEQLLAHCQRLDAVLGELAVELRPQQGELQGRLCVHLPRNYGIHCVAPLLGRFMAEHPSVRIDATYDDAYVDLVAAKVDLAVRAGRLESSQLVARRIGTMRRYLCATPGYLEQAPPLNDPVDLKAHRCLAFSGLRTGTLWQFTQQRRRRSVRIEPVLQCNDSKAIRDAVLAGVGIGIQGDYLGDPLVASGELVEILPDWQLSHSPIHLVWLPGADRAPAVRRLIDFLVTHLASG
ncbi:LysR family transcriptional regulator [Dyella jiangningensis]|uniref:LysR family transcriptional regulator n=1 Tax=Dyella jiangningensis TaxID=1379159 RepID=UPI00241010BF|nr:LysR family transcriptional regulator [Dyella jiangningensis]MDG2537013.1 LysR family transcriptional regulator [Dyella jiangningensis]